MDLQRKSKHFLPNFPPEFVLNEENWGIILTAENITSTTLTLVCTQSGGEPTGELETGSWFILEKWTQEVGLVKKLWISEKLEIMIQQFTMQNLGKNKHILLVAMLRLMR